MHLLVLSAFRLKELRRDAGQSEVSMHLLVLSAFRPDRAGPSRQSFEGSQCTFWCSVLSD